MSSKIFTIFECNINGIINDPLFDSSKTLVGNQLFQKDSNGQFEICSDQKKNGKTYTTVEVNDIGEVIDPFVKRVRDPHGMKIYCQTLDGNIELAKLINEERDLSADKNEIRMPSCLENLVVRLEEMF
jgi:hypothetical protein